MYILNGQNYLDVGYHGRQTAVENHLHMYAYVLLFRQFYLVMQYTKQHFYEPLNPCVHMLPVIGANSALYHLKLVCYCVNLANLQLYPELKNNNARATHGFVQELIQSSLFSYLLIAYFQNKPSSGQILTIPVCVYWFLKHGVQMGPSLAYGRELHAIPYISKQTCLFLIC